MAWLLKPEVAQAMRAARALGYQPTAEERAKFAAQMQEAYAARDSERPHIMTVAADTAEILVEGVLTEKPDCFALLFGGGNTTYEGIRKSLALAESDPAIKKVVMSVASPGGSVRGLFETLGAIEAFTKPISVNATLAASAAYGIAAVAGPITLQTLASEVGSIGVAVDVWVDEDLVQLTSRDAPNKRPDIRTEEGKGVVVDYLDAFHEIFVDAIARGRSASTGQKITAEQVNAEFGRGAVMLAKQAKAAGMVDRIAPQPKRTRAGARAETEDHEAPPAPSPAAAEQEHTTMNLEELKAKHPDLYKSVFDAGKSEGTTQGEANERKRVTAHLTLGKKCGAMDFAVKCIAEGKSSLDEDVHAEYIGAAANRSDQSARQTESDKASEATKGATPPPAPTGSLIEKFESDLPAKKAS